ncbi:unnamed protein product (mitochondrion) [Plasmodiophora brassicae]|uniref:Chromatin target of PRMT1 protein C-terminal domain-containing protein n=2 Tax=Plasmodiophora brassicae TaxID=37360 RepID=A0A3P3YLW6_PLABS|nr:unnamed protein product [Plasmodiophora brassicae]
MSSRGSGRGRGGRGRGGARGGGAGPSGRVMSLNERFSSLSSAPKTTFRAILSAGGPQQPPRKVAVVGGGAAQQNSTKVSRRGGSVRGGSRQKGAGVRGGKSDVRGGSGRGRGRGGGRGGGNRKLSKEELDMQMDEFMGRDTTEAKRAALDDDLSSYWSAKPAGDAAQEPAVAAT